MKDTISEIKYLCNNTASKHSELIHNLFEKLVDRINDYTFDVGIALYEVENLLDIFNPAKKEDIKILEQLKEKLERLNTVRL